MRVLALESSSRRCSVALLVDGALHWRAAAEDARNSEVLLPMARALLDEAGVALTTLDGIAFGAGPGAFTGLRVACGVAQGLAFGADLPVVGVGSLELLAESVRGAADGDSTERLQVLAALDARMGEVYWARLVSAGADWTVLEGPALAGPEHVPVPPTAGWLAAGDAFDLFPLALRDRLAAQCAWRAGTDQLPRADRLARLGALRLAAGTGVAPEHAQPVYVRDKVAQTERERAAAALLRAAAPAVAVGPAVAVAPAGAVPPRAAGAPP